MQNVIETDALCKRYGSHLVVDHLALTVPEGCVYGFLGPNGAGKSTTMKMLLGLVHPTGGTVRLLGREMTDANRLALLRQTGSLIESPSGYLHLTARENLEIVADLKGVPHKDIARVLDIVQLTNDQHRKVGQYSLGMKQRLGIAMALLGSPKLLVLDEPTNGLDPAGIQEMRELIRTMPTATGATVLISSHLLGEMEQMVEQVGIIDHGRMLFEGPLTELQRHSKGALTLRLLHPAKALPVLQANGLPTAAVGADAAPAGRPAGGLGAGLSGQRCRGGGPDPAHQDAGGNFPDADRAEGGGLRCCKPCMPNGRKPADDTILCCALPLRSSSISGWAAPRPPGRMNRPTPTAPCFTACPSSIPFCCRC